MDDDSIVAVCIATLGTILGSIQIIAHGDGALIGSMIGLYGTILGYFFGKRVAQKKDG